MSDEIVARGTSSLFEPHRGLDHDHPRTGMNYHVSEHGGVKEMSELGGEAGAGRKAATGMNDYISQYGSAEEMFRLAVEACPNGMVMIDGDGNMVMVNTEIENQFGYSREELIGQPVDMLVPARLRAQHIRHRQNFTPKPETRRMGSGRDLFGLRKDGTEFPVEVGLNPIRAGGQLFVLSVIVDISQRKQMERLKEEFVSTVSHELRTPLTSISGSLGLLVTRCALPDSAARLLAIAHTNCQRLVRLINDILDIEKIESGRVIFNLVRVDLKPLLRQTMEDNRGFAEGYGVQVELDPASMDAVVNVDPDRLAQVVTNLLSNAIKFSPASGRVMLGVLTQGNMVRITVRDHGPGIPEGFKPHIFGKFAQADGTISRQKGGTGLGLSIVKQIVERLGGSVGFEDAAGGGTVFYVDLPPWTPAAGGEIDVDAPADAPRVLLCEDDRDVAKTMRRQMRKAGFAVDFAHTIATAVERAEATPYKAILVDLTLREGDGIDLMLRIRAQRNNRDTALVVVAGDPYRGKTDVRASQLNVVAWLGKPIRMATLLPILTAAINPPPKQRARVLHVDDDHDVLALVAHELRAIADVVSVDSLQSARHALSTDRIDLAVLEVIVGGGSGLDLLPDLRDTAGNPIPVIIFSSDAARQPCNEQIQLALPKATVSLGNLATAVRDRLALLPGSRVKEVA
jgi:PAS domain S-box-containing protein